MIYCAVHNNSTTKTSLFIFKFFCTVGIKIYGTTLLKSHRRYGRLSRIGWGLLPGNIHTINVKETS